MKVALTLLVLIALGVAMAYGVSGRSHAEVSASFTDFKTPADFLTRLQEGKIILVDVREESEWQEGHVAGAVHIPLASLNARSVSELPKDVPIYLYCRSGRRAGIAQSQLRSLGFEKAKNIGGILDWQQFGGTLVR